MTECVCVCALQWSSVPVPGLSWLYQPYSVLYWLAAGHDCGDVIILSRCQTLLCSCIHFKVKGRRKAEAGTGGVEGSGLIFIQAHDVVAPLGPSIMGGFRIPAP